MVKGQQVVLENHHQLQGRQYKELVAALVVETLLLELEVLEAVVLEPLELELLELLTQAVVEVVENITLTQEPVDQV